MTCCLHELVGLTGNKTKKTKGQKKEGKTVAGPKLIEVKNFNWMPEHQQAFNVLKEALITTAVLGYPDFNREFMLETDASLKGLGPVLSQQDELGKLCNSLCKFIFVPI